MKNEWQTTSFRVQSAAHDKLKKLSERSGCKLKELLDEIIKRSARSPQQWRVVPGAKLDHHYSQAADLSKASRITFEVTTESLRLLTKIVIEHPDLSRDQVLSIMISVAEESFRFPMRAERKKIAKLRPQVKRIIGLSKIIDRQLKAYFPKDHLVYELTNWNDFQKALINLEGGFEKWSRDRIKANHLPGGPCEIQQSRFGAGGAQRNLTFFFRPDS